MTQDDNQLINLTRRQMLAGVGAVGLASAGAGLGTSALFRDTESFTGNRLVAGELDLLVDWQQHYSFNGETPYVNAYPDHDEDGEQSVLVADNRDGSQERPFTYSEAGGNLVNVLACDNFENHDPEAVLVDLDDVKPGDEGEITFSLHLCDNPGYIWMQAGSISEAGGAYTEPESELQEDGVADLADLIEVDLWYDTDCDNLLDEPGDAVDVMFVFDASGSLSASERQALEDAADEIVDEIAGEANVQVGQVVCRSNGLQNFQALQSAAGYTPNIGSSGGNTPLTPAFDVAQQELETNSGADRVVILLSDGGPNYHKLSGYSAGPHSAPRNDDWTLVQDGDGEYDVPSSDNAQVNRVEQDELARVAGLMRDAGTRIIAVNIGDDPTDRIGPGAVPLDVYLQTEIASPGGYFDVNLGDIVDSASIIGTSIAAPESVYFTGTLREALDAMVAGNGLALDGDSRTEFDEVDGDPTSEDRDCFPAAYTHCVAFRWYLPHDVGNEVQGDRVTFDLGFYTEQCRNNDGSGPAATPI